LAIDVAELVELADGGMVDARGGPRLALQPFAGRRVRDPGTQRLDRDGPVEAVIVRGIHDAHSPFAEEPGDPVASDRGPHAGRECIAGLGSLVCHSRSHIMSTLRTVPKAEWGAFFDQMSKAFESAEGLRSIALTTADGTK